MKTFDATRGYLDVCETFNREDYQGIMEHFYIKSETHKLELMLSPECIMSMDKRIFYDAVTLYSLRDLPVNLFAVDSRGSFNFRTKSNRYGFCKIVSHALERRFNNIKWDNLVSTQSFIHSNEKIILPEVLAACALRPELEMHLHYYLNPSMLSDSDYHEDVLWLVNYAAPSIKRIPSTDPILNYIESKILSAWTEIIFRTVTTLSFYFELNEMLRLLLKRHFKQEVKESFETSKRAALNSLTELNRLVVSLLQSNPVCKSLRYILIILKDLHALFIDQTNLMSRKDINRLFKSIVMKFENFAPLSIQGDWLYNLFYLFWKRRFSALEQKDIYYSLTVFFERNPTIYAINKVYLVYIKGYHAILTFGTWPLFDVVIPEDRLLDIYKKYPHILESRYKDIDFKVRLQLMVKDTRKGISLCTSAYTGGPYKFLSIPELPQSMTADSPSLYPSQGTVKAAEIFSYKKN